MQSNGRKEKIKADRLLSFSREGICLPLNSGTDVIVARQRARALATQWGFSSTEATVICSVISELARHLLLFAEQGEIILRMVEEGMGRCLVVQALDDGARMPGSGGISQGSLANLDSFGAALALVKRAVDEFEMVSEAGKGTAITVKKWKR